MDENKPSCVEDSVYPAEPDSEYGWEKRYMVKDYTYHLENYGIDTMIDYIILINNGYI